MISKFLSDVFIIKFVVNDERLPLIGIFQFSHVCPEFSEVGSPERVYLHIFFLKTVLSVLL